MDPARQSSMCKNFRIWNLNLELMKQLNTIFKKSFSAFAVILFGITASFAQVVTVPSGCTVKVPGTGGSIGLNQVGNGGVVAMPDNFSGGTFTVTTPSGYTLTGWSLRGDLSVTTSNTPPTAPTQSAGAVSSLSIESYNKNLRASEGAPGSPASLLAKSKGTVSIGYNAGACSGYSLTFDVYKTYTTTPPIVGPACVQGGTPCTFSVDQVASDNAGDNIGFDQYYWSGMPAAVAGSTYYSADNSSVTFTPIASSAFVIKCCLGRANPWDAGTSVNGTLGTTCVTKAIGDAPSEPTVGTTTQPLSVIMPLCAPTGSAATFTINYSSTNTCTWTAPNTGWTVGTPVLVSGNNYTVTVNTNGFNNPGVLTLTVGNAPCEPLTFQYQINRSLNAPVAITPVIAGTTCLSQGSSNNMFNISTSAAANPTTWTISPAATGVTLVPGSPNSTVAVNVSSGATAGTYTLTARSTACTGNITYTFRVRPVTPTISGPACVVRGALTSQTFTCAATPGATYTWSFPSGWTASSFTTATNSITVTPSSTTATLNGTVIVTANGIVGCNSAASTTIGYSAAAPTGVVAGCFSVGVPGTNSVTFTNPLPGTYTATLIPTGGGSNAIVGGVSFTSPNILTFSTNALSAGSYDLSITHNSGCGANATSVTTVNVVANGAQLFTSFSPGNPDSYFVITPPPSATYQWFVNGSPVAGATANNFSLNGPVVSPGAVTVCVNVTSGGCTTRLCSSSGTHTQRLAQGSGQTSEEEIAVYPNPTTGDFFVKVPGFNQKATATLYDITGKEISRYNLQKGENNIKGETLAKGTYIVILDIDGVKEAKKLIIK